MVEWGFHSGVHWDSLTGVRGACGGKSAEKVQKGFPECVDITGGFYGEK